MSKSRGRPFEPGNTYGKGRPKGSVNQQHDKTALDEYAPHLVRKCVAMAMAGNMQAMRTCIDKISPARRGARVRVNFPPIKTAEDVNQAAEAVTRAIRRGNISPSEGQALIAVLESRSRLIEKIDLENRIAKLEHAVTDIRSDDTERNASQATRKRAANKLSEAEQGEDLKNE